MKFYKNRRRFPRIPIGSKRDRLKFAWLPVFFSDFNMSVWLERYWVEEEFRMNRRFVRGWFTYAPGWDVIDKIPAEWAKKSPDKKVPNSQRQRNSDVINIDTHRPQSKQG